MQDVAGNEIEVADYGLPPPLAGRRLASALALDKHPHELRQRRGHFLKRALLDVVRPEAHATIWGHADAVATAMW